jgi:hypothetical protein
MLTTRGNVGGESPGTPGVRKSAEGVIKPSGHGYEIDWSAVQSADNAVDMVN